MKDSNKNINTSQKELDINKIIKGNSSNLIVSYHPSNELPKKSPQNFIKRHSPFLPKPVYSMDLSQEDGISLNKNKQNKNMHYFPRFASLTPQLVLKDHTHLGKKKFHSKDEVYRSTPNYNHTMEIHSSSPKIQYFNLDNLYNNNLGFQSEKKMVEKHL